jgi:hypothetical protein
MNITLMPVQHPRLELKLGHLVYPENKWAPLKTQWEGSLKEGVAKNNL